MNKAHSPINWENYPNETTPINEENLNKMDRAIGIIDDRVIEQESKKLSKTDASLDIVNVEYNKDTSVFEFTKRNGEIVEVDVSSVVDSELSYTSTNPVQNKVVTKEVSQLSEEIDDVKETLAYQELGNKSFEVISGEYVDPSEDGIFKPYGGWSRTDYVSCDGYDKLCFVGNTRECEFNAFYDVSKNYISSFTLTTGRCEIVVPSNAKYFALSNNTKPLQNTIIQTKLKCEIDSMKVLPIALTFVSGDFINIPDGIVKNMVNQSIGTSKVSVVEGEVYSLHGFCQDDCGLYSIQDDEGNVIEYYPTSQSNGWHTVIVTIPEGATKLYIGRVEEDSTCEQMINAEYMRNVEHNLNDRIKKMEKNDVAIPYEFALCRPMCIGDSLTQGAYYGEGMGGQAITENYPFQLGRILGGITVENAGLGGRSASDWYFEKIKTNTYNFRDYDSFIIWLGTNYGNTSMPTDEEYASFVIPTEKPDASTINQAPYLMKIIDTIKSAHPSTNQPLIALCKIFASNSWVARHNEITEQIAEKYGLPVIDLSDLTIANYPKLHLDINNPHFGKNGNIVVANRIASALRDYLAEDVLRCEFAFSSKH